jgi:hypothetical protein
MYGVDAHQESDIQKLNQLNSNWGAPEWNPSFPSHIANAYYQSEESIYRAFKLAYDHGATFVTPNYFTTTTTFPSDPLQLNQHDSFTQALNQFIADHDTTFKPGDLNTDGKVDIFDYQRLISKFGNPYTIFDYQKVISNFGR